MKFIDKKFEDLKVGDIIVFITEGDGYIFDYLQECKIQEVKRDWYERVVVIKSSWGNYNLNKKTFNNHFKVTRNKKVGLI